MAATWIALRKLFVPPTALVSRLVNTPPTCLASSASAPIRRLFRTDEGLMRADDTSSAVDVSRQGRSVSRRFRNRTPSATFFSVGNRFWTQFGKPISEYSNRGRILQEESGGVGALGGLKLPANQYKVDERGAECGGF